MSVLLFAWAQLDRDGSPFELEARGVLFILQLAIVFIAAVAATIIYSDLWSKRQIGAYLLLSTIPPALTVGGFMMVR
ncbi:MAG: hypothetical protein JWP03_710 [Phycisphaerales bacterium]|nr:hypothetical protein [Phycisphaerales bacterium]